MIRLSTWMLLSIIAATSANAATFTFRSLDDDGEGLGDNSSFAPVGGNNATTLGQARTNLLQEAGRIWGALLNSSVPIVVDVSFDALTCSASTGVLGQAGPRGYFANFTNAPQANVYYVAALADSIAGRNLSSTPTNPDINVTLNSNVDSDAACLGGRGFYYGFDHNRGTRVDLLNVLLHELGHGLGFGSEVDATTGAARLTLPGGSEGFTSYVHQLLDETLGRSWPQMTATERMESAVRTGSLAWLGTRANAQLGRFTSGGTLNGRLRMNAPATVSSGSSVSHWDPIVFPSVLMEPNLPASISIGAVDITACALADIGWRITRCPDDAAGNVPPVANSQSVSVAEDTSIVITLTATDANGDPLNFLIATPPFSGSLSAIAPMAPRTVTYTPGANANGNVSFTFIANDGSANSAPATVAISVTPTNDAPTAAAQNATVQTGQTVNVALSGADIDGDAVTYIVVSNPASGVLSGTAPNLNYRPNDGFTGTDTFSYRVSDGALLSSIVPVTITVTSPPPPASSGGDGGGGGGAMGGLWFLLLGIGLLRVARR